MTVRLDDAAHAEGAAQLQQQLVFVGGVDEDRVARLLAADDVDVVVHGSDDRLVDLDLAVLVMHACLLGDFGARLSPAPGSRLRFRRTFARRGRQL